MEALTTLGCLPLDFLLNDKKKKITLFWRASAKKHFLMESVKKQLNYPRAYEKAQEQHSKSWDGSGRLKVDSAATCRH